MHATFLEWEVCQRSVEGQQAKLSGSKEHVERFCEWYETTTHESSAITLFDVQKWMEEFQGDSNEELYMLKTIVEKDLRDFFFVGREIAQCLHESSEREEYYPYPATLL